MDKAERQFKYQTSRYRPRATFKKDVQLVFRRRLSKENRAMVWIHQERHAEIDRLAEATGLTISQVADTLIRFALNQMVVVCDDGTDVGLKEYMNDQLNVSEVPIHEEALADEPLAEASNLTGETREWVGGAGASNSQ